MLGRKVPFPSHRWGGISYNLHRKDVQQEFFLWNNCRSCPRQRDIEWRKQVTCAMIAEKSFRGHAQHLLIVILNLLTSPLPLVDKGTRVT